MISEIVEQADRSNGLLSFPGKMRQNEEQSH